MVVNADNKVEPRVIQANTAAGDKWIVADGLKAGERVIVEGTMKAGPNSVVVPVPFNPSPTTAAVVPAGSTNTAAR